MRLELTRIGLLAELANHYTTRGALDFLYGVLWLVGGYLQINNLNMILLHTANFYLFHSYSWNVSKTRACYSYVELSKRQIFLLFHLICKVKLATLVEGDPKDPFSITTTSRCRRVLHHSLDCSSLSLILIL